MTSGDGNSGVTCGVRRTPLRGPGDSRHKHAAGVSFHDDDDDDTNASGGDDDEDGSEDTPSEDTDADGDVDGATRRDKAGGAPSARTRQSPRLAELEANGAAGTTAPRVPNTTTHRSGDE